MNLKEHLEVFCCPICNGDLEMSSRNVYCKSCQYHFQMENDIPLLFVPNEWDSSKGDVTETVKCFYEKTPFPNYESLESVGDLIQKAQKGVYSRLLNEQIPFNVRVLEVGCGTGQLTNFLGVAHRYVFGVDMCLNSLKLGQNFRERNDLGRVGFFQMNLFRPIFRKESFPLVICNGVLHHTSDPFGGFQSISSLVQKGGYIIIGLYNTYGRIINDIRREIFKNTGTVFNFLDPRLRKHSRGEIKRKSWFADQYEHPHESKHTIQETLRWFDQTGFEFVFGLPNPKPFEDFDEKDAIFKKHSKGNILDHSLVQLKMLFSEGTEGGFYIMIGRKK